MRIDLAGQTIGAYRIIEQIGQGGMAVVYKAYEPALDRYVAIKVLPEYFAHDPDFVARFEREAKAIAKLDHPNILPIYGYGRDDGLTYIVMRYVQAGTLREMMGKPLDLRTAAGIVRQVAEALNYAHQNGVVHRDVKPSNILMADGKWALLTDFGLARMVESSAQLTKSGVGVGTPAYMSPEQGQGLKVDTRTDVYSLGVMVYEMVTGQVPYDAETPMAIVLKHITAPLPLPRKVNPGIPEAVERVILKAMAKTPGARFHTTTDLADALDKAVAKLPMPAKGEEVKPAPTVVQANRDTALVDAGVPTLRVRAPAAKKIMPLWALGGIGVVALLMLIAGMVFVGVRLISSPKPTMRVVAAATSTKPATQAPRPATQSTIPVTPVPPTPSRTPIPTYRIRIRITTTSDWTTFDLISGARWIDPDIISLSEGAQSGRFEEDLFRLIQPLSQAETGAHVELIADMSFTNIDPDGALVFEIERGHLGWTEVEVMNYLGTEPVAAGAFVWDKIAPTNPNTRRFELPAASLTHLRIVSIDLGAENEEHGLAEIGVRDGQTAPHGIGGKSARVTVDNGMSPARYIYFKADRDFIFAQETKFRVTVEYFDQGRFEFWLDYDSTDATADMQGRYKHTQHVRLTDSGVWKVVTFDLPDAYFGGRQNEGADFRIATNDNDLYINSVTVAKP